MNELFRHLYETDTLLFSIPIDFHVWQVIEMLSRYELDAYVLSRTVC